MPRYVAFLRGINLGRRRLSMDRLRTVVGELGYADVTTFIASGNVLFSTRATKSAVLEARITKHLEASLGYPVDTFVRTAAEVTAIAAAKLFPEDGDEVCTIHVGFLHRELPPATARALAAIRTATDAFRVTGREFYWLCRIRTSESKVWTSPEIRALRLPTATMRNFTSVRKLVAKHLD